VSQFIQGDKELIAKLQALSKKHAGGAIRKGSRAGSKIIASAMKANAPVKTGALKASIKVRALPRRKNVTGTRVIETAYYAGFVEFKTKHNEAKQGGSHAVEKSADATKDQAMATFLDTMKAEIEDKMKQ
jgi:HK97 gp10 family phage protein